jgi:hypothetical protein
MVIKIYIYEICRFYFLSHVISALFLHHTMPIYPFIYSHASALVDRDYLELAIMTTCDDDNGVSIDSGSSSTYYLW